MMALDAKTGIPIPAFGRNGVVDLKTRDRPGGSISTPPSSASTPRRSSSATSIVVGAAHRPGVGAADDAQRERVRARLRRAHRQAALDLPHDSAARRVRLRHLAGRVRRIQRQHRRLGADERRSRSSDSSTCPSRCRPATTTAATGPATTLFADSLVALDVKTGRRKWHYQTVHHDVWDWDLPCAPILFDMTRQRPHRQGARAADQAGVPLRASTARPASRSGRSKSGPCRSRTCRRSGPARRSRSRRSRRRSIGRASPRTTCST